MKRYLFLFTFFLIFASQFPANAQNAKSYMLQQIGARMQGQVPTAPTNSWMIIYFSDDNKSIFMTDGTNWKYKGTNMYGQHLYAFDGITGRNPIPYYQYQELIAQSDFSQVEVHYMFGPMGMTSPMYALYRFVADGAETAQSAMEQQFSTGSVTGLY